MKPLTDASPKKQDRWYLWPLALAFDAVVLVAGLWCAYAVLTFLFS